MLFQWWCLQGCCISCIIVTFLLFIFVAKKYPDRFCTSSDSFSVFSSTLFFLCCNRSSMSPYSVWTMAGFLINRMPQIIDLAILGNKVELIMTNESFPAPPAPLASDLAPERGQVPVDEVEGHSMGAFATSLNAGNAQPFALRQAERTRGASDLSPALKTGVITS